MTDTANRYYFAEQYPDLADVFLPKTKAQMSLAQPTPPRRKRTVAALPLRAPERAGDVIVISLPLPPKPLSPNGRSHWGAKSKAVKAARTIAKTFVQHVATSDWLGRSVRLDVRRWADKKMDSDNFWGALKAYRDGIADGLMTTDAQFELGDIQQFTGVKSEGRREVEICITRIDAA
jgi:crossover junction endodeoxyribonuclease RusA